jgi:GDP/UDP-N,N'-diacetylbacillosamine 2-epimerase (hydrolysing)
MLALKEVDLIKIFILPNNDVGSDLIKAKINGHDLSHAYFFKNLARSDYLSILNDSKFIIGNSSSGILEAPTYQVPCVNIGGRQNKRYQGSNVINCDFKKDCVLNAISSVLDDDFKEKMFAGDQFPYGSGNSSQQIVEIFKTVQVDRKLLVKELTV